MAAALLWATLLAGPGGGSAGSSGKVWNETHVAAALGLTRPARYMNGASWEYTASDRVKRGQKIPAEVLAKTVPVSRALQLVMEATVAYLNMRNIPTPPIEVRMTTGENLPSVPWLAYAVPGMAVLHPDFAANWEHLATVRERGVIPDDPQFALAMLHEALHQTQTTQTWAEDPETLERMRGLAEGLNAAVTLDLGQDFVGHVFGPKMHRAWASDGWKRILVVNYDEVMEVRRRSAWATGEAWNSPEAFAWRVALKRMSFPDRQKVWEAVQGPGGSGQSLGPGRFGRRTITKRA